MHGSMLSSLQKMYSGVKMCVRSEGNISECFASDRGVKQGDPLSPFLFGIFIDRIESFMRSFAPNIGVPLGHILLQLLLYADDLVIFSESAAGLQKLLDILYVFCHFNALTVNIKKSEVVIFNSCFLSDRGVGNTFTYSGESLKMVDSFVYLGMEFNSDSCGWRGGSRMIKKSRAAMFSLMNKCDTNLIHNVTLRCKLFDTLVKPICAYGCEIWGPYSLAKGPGFLSGLKEEAEKLQSIFLRRCLHIRRSTSTACVLHELNRIPIPFLWIRQILNFWNKIQRRNDDDIVKLAMIENFQLAADVRQCWVSQLRLGLQRFDLGDFLQIGNIIDVDSCMDKMVSFWKRESLFDVCGSFDALCVRDIPDNQHAGFKIATFLKWFIVDDHEERYLKMWRCLHHPDFIQVMAQFRLGSHWLNVEWGRFSRPYVPRSERFCKLCDLGMREDEVHVIFECPFYDGLRKQFPIVDEAFCRFQELIGLEGSDVDKLMRDLIWCRPMDHMGVGVAYNQIAKFLLKSKSLRSVSGEMSGD